MRFGVIIAIAAASLVTGMLATDCSAQTFLRAPNFRAKPSGATAPSPFVAPVNNLAPVESENFVVYAATTQLANKVSREAERYRKELAQEWLGRELPRWQQKCPITVKVERHAGGETSFAFMPDQTGRSLPIDWRMKIFGPPDRLLDAVLPHEITHTIFATHFGRPLPRWADEGACTTVEHVSERKKNHQMLMQFLSAQPSRGIPFNRMFTMRNYPSDILPLYAQGYSLARFLIQKKGRRHFLDYVSKGLENENRNQVLRAWDKATNEFYGFDDLSDLQIEWLAWVKNGSPDHQIASNDESPKSFSEPQKFSPLQGFSAPQRIAANDSGMSKPLSSVAQAGFVEVGSPALSKATFTSNDSQSGSWYKRQMNAASRVAQNQELTKTRKISPDTKHVKDSRLPASPQTTNSQTIWR